MKQTQRFTTMLVCGLAAGMAWGQGSVWFVDDDAPDGGDGLGWATAFNTLDDALAVAVDEGDQVWVAEGVYTPSTMVDPTDLSNPTTDPRDATFFVRKGVEVYGGFAGYEETLDDRVGLFAQTILSGDITLSDGSPGFARHVVFYFSEGNIHPHGRLDGFTVRHGMAGQGAMHGGGGLLAGDFDGPDQNGYVYSVRIDIANCRFEDNVSDHSGGGVSHQGPLHVTDSVFIGNTAEVHGGGLAIGVLGGNSRIINCSFLENTAGKHGGGFSLNGASTLYNPDIINSRFIGNAAGEHGGGINFSPNGLDAPMRLINTLIAQNTSQTGGAVRLQGGKRINQYAYIKAAKAEFWNCTFADNSATVEGGGLFLDADTDGGLRSSGDLYNSIIWGNSAAVGSQLSDGAMAWFCDVQGGWDGGAGNINLDPFFMDAAGGNYHLMYSSPLVDSSSSLFAPTDEFDLDGDGNTAELIPYDLDGRARFFDVPLVSNTGSGDVPFMDYGALESQPRRFDAGNPGQGNTVFLDH